MVIQNRSIVIIQLKAEEVTTIIGSLTKQTVYWMHETVCLLTAI